MASFVCPNCGGVVPAKAKACPHCGSDENTGWSDETYLDGLGLYDEEDYRETLRKEFGHGGQKPGGKQILMAFTALVVVIVFIMLYVLRC